MSEHSTVILSQNDEIDLRDLWRIIWQGKWLIVCVSVVFMVSSIFYAMSIPDEYRATAILAPASASSSSSLSRLAGQFGGLASLAGVNLGGENSSDKTIVAMELIKTWGFLEQFIVDNSLEVEVFAANGWDKYNNKLLVDDSLYDEEASSWVREVNFKHGGEQKPTSWELYSAIKNKISISQNKTSGLVLLSVEHYSPFVAKKWVDLLVVAINSHIQHQEKENALNSMVYLKEQVNKTRVAEMQTIFYQLIESQAKTLMLTEISDEYVLKTLSAAKVAEEKQKPKRTVIVILGTLVGVLVAIFVVFVRLSINKRR